MEKPTLLLDDSIDCGLGRDGCVKLCWEKCQISGRTDWCICADSSEGEYGAIYVSIKYINDKLAQHVAALSKRPKMKFYPETFIKSLLKVVGEINLEKLFFEWCKENGKTIDMRPFTGSFSPDEAKAVAKRMGEFLEKFEEQHPDAEYKEA